MKKKWLIWSDTGQIGISYDKEIYFGSFRIHREYFFGKKIILDRT